MSRKFRIGTTRNLELSDEAFVTYSNPGFWLAKARELHRAALVLSTQLTADWESLWRHVQERDAGRLAEEPQLPTNILPQFVLLSAFAIENLLKGLLLFKEPNLVLGGKTSGILRSHDLLSLAARADVELTPDEHSFCVLASSAAVYWGRYPVSNSAHAYIDAIAVSGASFELFDRFFLRLSQLYMGKQFPAASAPTDRDV